MGCSGKTTRIFSRSDERRLLDSLNDQTALAIERAELVEKVDEAQVLAEADKLRVAMLTSLSHDLRTPLASILGAATTLLANLGLYDMSNAPGKCCWWCARRRSGWTASSAIFSTCRAWRRARWVEAADGRYFRCRGGRYGQARSPASGHKLREEIPEDLPFASADPLLLEQALVNLLDNAIKYSPVGSEILVTAHTMDERIVLTVEDEGPGIPLSELPHIFDKFYRVRKADHGVAGTGLGLSVARGFIEAFGGTLAAANRSDRSGAIFTMTIPVSKPQSVE